MSIALWTIVCAGLLALAVQGDESIIVDPESIVEATTSDDVSAPTLPLVISRHMKGLWQSRWTSGCTRRVTTGQLAFDNETSQYFAWRSKDGVKYDYNISGEGTTFAFLPFLRHIEKPMLPGSEFWYGYQICTQEVNQIETNSDENKWGPVTETRVMRGFVFEVSEEDPNAALVLDRCVDGLNRNYNLFITTVGVPIAPEEQGAGPLTRNIRYVRWQLRLPGNMKCDSTRQPHAEPPEDGYYDRAADDSFDVFVWTRTERPLRSFYEEHFNMLVFAGLFIVFRVFVGYRYNSQKLQIQREFVSDVQKDEADMKRKLMEQAAAAASKKKRK